MPKGAIRKNSLNIITRANFDKTLPQVLSILEKATFVSLDTELSGLCTFRSNRYSLFDDLQQRYAKLADSASAFALLQFGLGIFHFDEAVQRCTCSVFSFHLFPAAVASHPEKKFSMQLSCIEFLSEHKFDFNASLNEGISFMSRAEEQLQLARIDPEAAGQASKERHAVVELTKKEDREFVKDVMDKVDAWVEAGASGRLELPSCNGYQRLLTYQQIELKYSDRLMVNKSVASNGAAFLSVTAPSQRERVVLEMEEQKGLAKKLRSDVGFRQVIDKIIDLQLPIVGHNCLLDLCHIHDKFIGKLPSLLSEFKHDFTRCFPVVFDTKMIASADPELSLSGSYSLSDLYNYFRDCKKDLLNAPVLNTQNEHFHDAGYDAYCTGLVFIGLAHKASGGTLLDPLAVFMQSGLRNKCFVMQSPYVEGLNLGGPDAEPDRGHIFLLSGFSDKWRTSQVSDALGKLLGRELEFSTHLSRNQNAEAFISFKSDAFKTHDVVCAATAHGTLVIDGVTCRWQSFESSRSGSGKRDANE